MKKVSLFLMGLTVLNLSTVSKAENLLQVYQQAKAGNPVLRKAAAERAKAFEKIRESRSSLLPQLNLSGSYNYQDGFRDKSGTGSNSFSAKLVLTQTLFDMSKWRHLTSQEKMASIKDIDFQKSEQGLLLDTADAYFNVLRAMDTLSFAEAKKTSVYRQLDQTSQRFKVGLVAITDVQNARADYDSILADEVRARNTLDNMLEVLHEISGGYYSSLNSLNVDRLKVASPEPIGQLVKKAQQKNLELLAARLSQEVARNNIKLAQAGHMPTLNLNAYSEVANNYKRERSFYVNNTRNDYSGQHNIGISLDVPLYKGGATHSQVKQAQYEFIAASEQLTSTERKVMKTLRSSFNDISASISGISAYQQAVVSAKSSLNSMEAGYKAGTRTILDVLKATSALYDARQKLSNARYDYLINQLKIKFSLGDLNQTDLVAINRLLEKSVSTSANQ